MITYYFSGGPNPQKVSLLLEELGIAYRPVKIDVMQGEQHDPAFLALNPNAKLPVIVDDDGVVVFDSNAILLHLGVKHGRFVPEPGSPLWGETLSWLMFVATGLGPFSGQAVHFRHASPEPVPYAATRYDYEARRHFTIVEQRLATREFMAGTDYSIVDMALWGWAPFLPRILGEGAQADFPNVTRLADWIGARPAAQRALALPGPGRGSPPPVRGNPHLFGHLRT
jgi:GST-like protein